MHYTGREILRRANQNNYRTMERKAKFGRKKSPVQELESSKTSVRQAPNKSSADAFYFSIFCCGYFSIDLLFNILEIALGRAPHYYFY